MRNEALTWQVKLSGVTPLKPMKHVKIGGSKGVGTWDLS